MTATELEKQYKELKKDLERLQADFGRLTRDTGKTARQAGDTAQEAGATALAKLEEEATRLLDTLKGASQSVVESGEDVVAGVHDQIRERPLIAAAIGVGLGLGVWVLLGGATWLVIQRLRRE